MTKERTMIPRHLIHGARLLCLALVGAAVLVPSTEAASVRSVQSGTVVLSGGPPSQSIQVTAPQFQPVDDTRAFLVFNYRSLDVSRPQDVLIAGEILTGGTTLEFSRASPTTTTPITIQWYVVEFSSGVSVQRGFADLPDGAPTPDVVDVPIAPVTLANSFPLISQKIGSTFNFTRKEFVRAELTSTTNLRLVVQRGSASTRVPWQVVEYTDGSASVQSGNVTFPDLGAGSLSQTVGPITAVDTTKSWLLYTYDSANGQNFQIGPRMVRGRLTNSTTLDFDRDVTGPDPGYFINLTWYLVEFTDGTTVRRGDANFANGEFSRTEPITPAVNLAYSIAAGGAWQRGGKTPRIADTVAGNSFFTQQIVSPTQLLLERGVANDTADLGWFVVEFRPPMYYSIGTETAALHSGTATATGGVMTLSAAAANRIGVGDEVRFDPCGGCSPGGTADRYYISGRMSSTQFTIQDSAATGTPGDVDINFGLSDIEIYRAFNLVSDAVAQSSDANHLGTWDLTSGNGFQLNWTCYEDGPIDDTATIDGYTTGAGTYIHLYAPFSIGEVGATQRHNGKAGTGCRIAPIASPGGDLDVIAVLDEHVRFTGIEVDGAGITNVGSLGGFQVDAGMTDVRFDSLIVHDLHGGTFGGNHDVVGLDLWGGNVKLSNSVIYDLSESDTAGGDDVYGVRTSDAGSTFYLHNNTIFRLNNPAGGSGANARGIRHSLGTVIARNNLVLDMNAAGGNESFFGPFDASSSNNVSSDGTAPGAGSATGQTAYATYFVNINNGLEDLHLLNDSPTLWGVNGADLDQDPNLPVITDFERGLRPATNPDIGADEFATTAVELHSFLARAADAAVDLEWRTGSELNNLGFHLYRAVSEDGPWERLTERLIPGLGSSPEGAGYSYRDAGLVNGTTYYYQLEDIETTGQTEKHGPVSATPGAGVTSSPDEPDEGAPPASESEDALITYGEPSSSMWRVTPRGRDQIQIELETNGFYALPQEDGSVRLSIPGFVELGEADAPALPVKRHWVEAIAGRKVELLSVKATEVEAFTSLRPSQAAIPEVVASYDGTVRAVNRRARKAFRGEGLSPSSAARLLDVGFQGEVKKALVELAPLRWDAARGQLLLARRLVVRMSFRTPDPSEEATRGRRGRRYRRRRSHDERSVAKRLVTTEQGLYAVRYEDVLSGSRSVPARSLSLSRQGKAVAFHLEPNRPRFQPGSTLYFMSEGASLNPYGNEAVYELEVGSKGTMMPDSAAAPSGEPTTFYMKHVEQEQNRYYQAALMEAPDRWLWDLLFAPVTKSYPFEVSALASTTQISSLSVWLQGVSDFEADPDHHVRVYVNGSLVGESSWDGKGSRRIDVELLPGVLVEGENRLEVENVGDTGAAYSMVMLDRFALSYPRVPMAESGELQGEWKESGVAAVSGLGPGRPRAGAERRAPALAEGSPKRFGNRALPSGIWRKLLRGERCVSAPTQSSRGALNDFEEPKEPCRISVGRPASFPRRGNATSQAPPPTRTQSEVGGDRGRLRGVRLRRVDARGSSGVSALCVPQLAQAVATLRGALGRRDV